MKHRCKAVAMLLVLSLTLAPVLSGCQAKSEGTIKIATKPMTEQLILGEMLAILIEDNTDLKVELTKGIAGGTSNIQPAMEAGEFDLYPEYTGTGWSNVLKKTGIPPHEELYPILQQEYKDKLEMEWVGLYGFNNTYALAVRKEIADEHGLKTYSDLVPIAGELVFGANYDFYEREDGYDGLCEAYGFEFKDEVDIDIGLKYQAINSGQIDVMNAFTTDGQLSVADVAVLEDDKGFYQTYLCGTVVRSETLQLHPELRDVLMLMQDLLTDGEMAALNYQVENENLDERDVAMEFLRQKGLVGDGQ